jgi:class 3 adenylate cyclase/putative methionine-R-sulfoxide reductase with GAF domain
MSDSGQLLSRDDMLALLEVSRELNAQVTLSVLLSRVLARAGELTDSPDTSVILRHSDGRGLYVAAATGDKADWVLTTFGKHSAKCIPIDGSKAGQVFTSQVSLVENQVEGHFKGVDEETKKHTGSMVCVPLRVGTNSIGVMQILNKRSGNYTEIERVLLEHFAAQVAVAIQNAQLFEELLAHSGLYSRSIAEGDLAGLILEMQKPAQSEVLTVLFADLRGFTQLCQSLPTPAELQVRLNEFMAMLADEIINHDGTVNKFLGDGVMALFRQGNHSERAVKAAFEMVDRFTEMRIRWDDETSQSMDFLDIGVGIVTDQVTLGAVGSGKVREFTAIGSAVNLASAFEQDARQGRRIIVNQLAYRNVKDFVEANGPEEYVLKKPGQTVGVKYRRYALTRLATDSLQQIFVSHSHQNREHVESLLVKPLNDLGIRTWYAADNIPKGAFWPVEIRKALSNCQWMIVVVSRASSESNWVRLEVDLAMALGRMRERIIPVLLDDTPLQAVNEYLASMQAIDLRLERDPALALAKVIREHQAAETSKRA